MARLIAIFAAIAVFTLSLRAQAHPHVWIEAVVKLHFAKGKIVAISHVWKFDEIFSTTLISQFDKNRNGVFEKPELSLLQSNAFAALKGFRYFTHVRVAKQYRAISGISNFSASMDRQRVSYRFTAKLAKPIDPLTTKVDFLFLDQTFYVAVDLKKGKGSVSIVGKPPRGCQAVVVDDKENPIYSGLVIPKMVTIRCPAS